MKPLSRTTIAASLIVILSACSSGQVYSGLQERERNLCREGPEVEFSECMARQQMSYQEYQATANTVELSLETPVTNIQRVERYVNAFNRHDIDAMLRLTTGDVRWMSIADDQVSTETRSNEELRHAMAEYFKSRPDSYSRLLNIQGNGPFVATLEQAGTIDKPGDCALAIYEFTGSLIRNVWYYSAYTCEAQSPN